MSTRILGLGHHLPPAIDCGGALRAIAVEPVGPSTLAVPAANAALATAGLAPADVEFLVFATMTPDVCFPGAACYLQHQLRCETIGALDIRAQCAGFLFALTIADRFVQAGAYRNVLVVGGEVHSSGLDYSPRGIDLARRYADGVGVALLGREDGPMGVRSTVLHTDGHHHREFWCEYPASRHHPFRLPLEEYERGSHFPSVDLDAVRTFGLEALPAAIDEALQAAAITADRVDAFIVGHLLPEVVEAVGERLGAGERLVNPAATHGHLTAAALPVALSEEVAAGRLGAGATVCLAAAGAGFAWGAAVVTL